MNDIAEIITAVATLIASIVAAITSWRNAKRIEHVYIATNSLTDRLVATTKSEAHAAGMKAEREKTT